MELLVSYSFSAEVIIKALSWTLLHSLWQGLLLALVAGAIVLGTKKAKPSLRYNILVMAIGLFIVCVVVTFLNQLSINTQIAASNLIQTLPGGITKAPETSKVIIGQSSMIIQTINFININAIWIVAIWLMIIVIKFIKLGSGLYNIYKLKHKMVSPTLPYWNKRLNELCGQLNISKKIVLLQSNMLSIPSVIGYFKPVILFPAAMFSALTIQEIEAILMHELGHIRRNDFIINILQNILEVIFFFNPAVIWVSTLIKTERENCCDDIAVSFTGNKQDYIKALISFSEFEQTEKQQFATSFSGDNKHLLNRAKRIIYNKNNTLNIMEKKFLSASLILVTICLLAFVSLKAKNAETEGNHILKTNINTNVSKNEMLLSAQDTIPIYKIRGKSGMTGITNTTMEGKAYQIFIKNGQITNMYINGKKIPNEEIVNYKPILDKIYENMIIDQEMAIYDSEKAIIDSKQELKDYEQAMRDSEQAMRDSEQAVRDSETMNEIIDALIANNIIKNQEDLYELMFNADKLEVNGVKQSNEMLKTFKAKFTVSSDWSWVYITR